MAFGFATLLLYSTTLRLFLAGVTRSETRTRCTVTASYCRFNGVFLLLIDVVFSKESVRSTVLHFFHHLTSVRHSRSRSYCCWCLQQNIKRLDRLMFLLKRHFWCVCLLWIYLYNIFCFGPFTISWLSDCLKHSLHAGVSHYVATGESVKITSVAQNSKSFGFFFCTSGWILSRYMYTNKHTESILTSVCWWSLTAGQKHLEE